MTDRPAQLRPSRRRGRARRPPPQAMVASLATRRGYQKQKIDSTLTPAGRGRQAGAGSSAGTLKRRLWRGR